MIVNGGIKEGVYATPVRMLSGLSGRFCACDVFCVPLSMAHIMRDTALASRTIENYLKNLYLEQQQVAAGETVAMGRLAEVMNVVPGTATTMVKALADSGLVAYSPRNGAKLTAAGKQLALHVLRRHRLVELFLVRVVGLDWSEVHAEAEELEHVISEKLLDRMDTLLGHPTADPHGDPIPTPTGNCRRVRRIRWRRARWASGWRLRGYWIRVGNFCGLRSKRG